LIEWIPEDEKYHIVHHLKQKLLKVLCLDFCKLHEQLPFSEPASFTKNMHILTLKTCIKMRKFSIFICEVLIRKMYWLVKDVTRYLFTLLRSISFITFCCWKATHKLQNTIWVHIFLTKSRDRTTKTDLVE
jgi:hypothetical protein